MSKNENWSPVTLTPIFVFQNSDDTYLKPIFSTFGSAIWIYRKPEFWGNIDIFRILGFFQEKKLKHKNVVAHQQM